LACKESIYLVLSFSQSPRKGAPSTFPNRVPTERDTPSPESLAKRGDSVYLLINSFIHSFIHVCLLESPKRIPPAYIQEKHKVIVHRVPRRRNTYIPWGTAWFPKIRILKASHFNADGLQKNMADCLHFKSILTFPQMFLVGTRGLQVGHQTDFSCAFGVQVAN